MAITVMEVLKNLPRTNCGDCGQATCLAFATQVIKEGEDLDKCPHLTGAGAEMGQAVRAQQEAGVGRRRESLAISLEVLQEKVAPLDFAALAEGLGAAYGEEAGRPFLSLSYFGYPLQVFKDELRYPPGAPADPWDAILLYNYIASQAQEPVAGRWIAYNSLPNSVSKAKTLARLEQKLADHFADARDILLADAADVHQVRLPRENVLVDAAFLAVVLAAAASADIHRRRYCCLRIRLPELRHPARAHRVVDDAVAERQQPQLAALGQYAARARKVRPVVRRRREAAGRHLRLDRRDLRERTLGRPEDVVAFLRLLSVLGRLVRRVLRGQRAFLGKRDGRVLRHVRGSRGYKR